MKANTPIYHKNLLVAASQLSWVLQYYGNGIYQDLPDVDGTKLDPKTGLSIHGFIPGDFATEVTSTPDKYRICG